MKKSFLFSTLVLTVFACCLSYSQTLVSSQKLELKKPWDKRQIAVCSPADGNSFYVFAADKQKTAVLLYNRALFFKDSLSVKRSQRDAEYIAGTSIDSVGNPFMYWMSQDQSKIHATGFDVSARKSFDFDYSISYQNETFLNAFSAFNCFYVLTVDDNDPKITVYAFRNGKPEKHVIDVSRFKLQSQKGKDYKWFDFFELYPLRFITPSTFCPLSDAASKSKLYAGEGSLLLALDHDPRFTQIFEISTKDFSITETRNAQPPLSVVSSSASNSFLLGRSLCQIRTSDTEMVLSFENGITGDSQPKEYYITPGDTITFKNSPFFVQNADKRPSDLKTTAKFLKRLSGCTPGVSLYDSPQGTLVVAGGIRQTVNATNAILGATLGVGVIAAGGGGVNPGDFFDASMLQQVYFESLFDANFDHVTKDQLSIAPDFVSGFFAQNDNVATYAISSFGNALIMAYYDSEKKAVVLRKFEDARPPDPLRN